MANNNAPFVLRTARKDQSLISGWAVPLQPATCVRPTSECYHLMFNNSETCSEKNLPTVIEYAITDITEKWTTVTTAGTGTTLFTVCPKIDVSLFLGDGDKDKSLYLLRFRDTQSYWIGLHLIDEFIPVIGRLAARLGLFNLIDAIEARGIHICIEYCADKTEEELVNSRKNGSYRQLL